MSDDFKLVRGIDRILRGGASVAYARIGKQLGILRGSHISLYLTIEFLGLAVVVRSHRYTRIRIPSEYYGRKKPGRSLAFAVLGRHRDNQLLDLPRSEPVQDAVIDDMKLREFQTRIDILGKKPENISGLVRTPLVEGICIHFHSASSSDRN